MIICYHTKVNRQWDEQELTDYLSLFSENQKKAILRKRQWLDRQLSVTGKLLLIRMLDELGLDARLSLLNLKYNNYQRPYFNADFDFNIAHSHNRVVCCGTINGEIGIDIEFIKSIDLDDFVDYFTTNEWQQINNAINPTAEFYHYWTRKEAVIKAIGTGLYVPLSMIDISGESLIYNGSTYYIQEIVINENCKCHIAATEKPDTTQVAYVEI